MGLHKDCLSIIYNSVNMDVRVCGNDVAYLLFYQALLAFRANSVNRHSVIRFKATGGFPMKHLYESSMHKKKWPTFQSALNLIFVPFASLSLSQRLFEKEE